MSLIECPECGHKVSNKAETCPECGFIINEYEEVYEKSILRDRKVTTIELTGKNLKLQKVLSILFIIIGLIWAVKSKDVNGYSRIATWVVVVGIAWYIINHIRIWWNHK